MKSTTTTGPIIPSSLLPFPLPFQITGALISLLQQTRLLLLILDAVRLTRYLTVWHGATSPRDYLLLGCSSCWSRRRRCLGGRRHESFA